MEMERAREREGGREGEREREREKEREGGQRVAWVFRKHKRTKTLHTLHTFTRTAMLHLALVSLLALARRDPSTAASTWAGKSQLNSTQLKWQSSLTSSILKLQLRDTQLILISNALRSTDCSVLLAKLALVLDARSQKHSIHGTELALLLDVLGQ